MKLNDVTRPLCLRLSKMTGYINKLDNKKLDNKKLKKKNMKNLRKI